jgi:hypothetical protein
VEVVLGEMTSSSPFYGIAARCLTPKIPSFRRINQVCPLLLSAKRRAEIQQVKRGSQCFRKS